MTHYKPEHPIKNSADAKIDGHNIHVSNFRTIYSLEKSMKNGPYYYVAVENFSPEEYEPTTEKIRVRPLPGQGIDQNARVECDRSHMRHNFSLGTVFIIKGKITDREDGPAFVYSYFGWPYITIPRETALQLIAEQKVGFFESALFNGFCEMRAFPIKFFKLGKSE